MVMFNTGNEDAKRYGAYVSPLCAITSSGEAIIVNDVEGGDNENPRNVLSSSSFM